MTLKRWLPLKGRPLDPITIWSREHCIVDHMMESSSVACHTKKHMRHSKKLMTVCVELTSSVQNLEIDSKDWDIIGQRWSLIPSLTLSDATPVRFMVTSFTRHQDIFILQLLPGHLRCGEWTRLVLLATFIQRTSVYLSHNWLFLQMDWSDPPEGGKDIWHDQVH